MSERTPPPGVVHLVPTKISPPLFDDRLARRERLDRLLDRGGRVVLVVAPAGYGKTVAVAQWAQHVAEPVAWYTVDEHDRTPARFWRYLAASLGRVVPSVGAETIRSIEEWAVDGIDMATVLLAELGEEPAPMLLVLDEVHLIAPALIEQLAFFIDRLPPSLRVVLCSRADPALPTARWRARGWITEVRQHDLALEPAEALGLLRGMDFVDIDETSAQRLIDVTEGWPAALHLACLSLRGRDDVGRFVGEVLSSDRMLFDYVVGEVLDRLSVQEREAVLALSLLTDIDPPRCVTMTGVSDGRALLERLTRLGLPIVALDSNRRTVRFHDLFRSLVRLELELRDAPALAALHRQAAMAERAAGDDPAAVRHLLAAGEQQEAFELVFGPVWDLYRSGSTRESAVWLDRFPEDFVGADPARVITFATTLSLIGRLDDAARWNDRAATLLGPADDLVRGLTFSRILVHLGRGDTAAVRNEVDELHPVDHGAKRWDPIAAVATIMALCALVDDDLDDATRWVEVIGEMPALPERARAVGHPARRAWVALEEGRLDEADRLADTSLAESGDERRGAAHAITELFVVKARTATERLDVDAASLWSERAVDLAAELGAPLYRFLAHAATLGAIEVRSGSTHASIVAEDMASGEVSGGLLPRYRLMAAELAARAGRLDDAELHLADLSRTPRRRLVEARVELGRGRSASALDLLADIESLSPRQQIEAELLRHLTTGGDTAHLHRALEFGVRRGFVWTYVREGPEVTNALWRLMGADSRWASTRLGAAVRDRLAVSTPTSYVLVEPLSAKESAVLQLFPTHLSTVEMAGQLFVSASTVRTHVKAIYRKLEVNSRSEAVVRAQALGLTPPVGPPARA